MSEDTLGVLSKPRFQALPAELVAFVKLNQEVIGLEVVEIQSEAVNAQERSGHSNCGALVSIDKGVILGKALKQSGSLFDDGPVIAALRPGQSGFEGAAVANALCPAEQNEQARVSGKHFVEGRVERHWASRRSNSG